MEKISEKVKDFVSKHQSLLGFLTLLVFCYVMLFMRLGFYPLIDVDETRYVGISLQILNGGDWIIPFLNGTPFLEKPPLYFWLNALFFNFFGEVSAFSARFGTALLAFLSVMATYLFSKKALGYTYALIASFILLGNVWFLIFSHVAILDMGFMAFTMCAIYCAAATMFLEDEKYKKYCWWGGWLFMGLGVLMKGLIGFIVPACSLQPKNLKKCLNR
jgi:4-amino-4-deoxy-L-arabinose transferase-like glycosyltransferase